MQTVFAFPLLSCRLALTSATPSAPPLVRDVGKAGGALFSPPSAQGLCRPAFVRKRGSDQRCAKVRPHPSPITTAHVKEDNERRVRRRRRLP